MGRLISSSRPNIFSRLDEKTPRTPKLPLHYFLSRFLFYHRLPLCDGSLPGKARRAVPELRPQPLLCCWFVSCAFVCAHTRRPCIRRWLRFYRNHCRETEKAGNGKGRSNEDGGDGETKVLYLQGRPFILFFIDRPQEAWHRETACGKTSHCGLKCAYVTWFSDSVPSIPIQTS